MPTLLTGRPPMALLGEGTFLLPRTAIIAAMHFSRWLRYIMSAIERLLVPGSTDLPACHCGDDMRITSHDSVPEKGDAVIGIYKCPSCAREMRLTVWTTGSGSERDEAGGATPGFSA